MKTTFNIFNFILASTISAWKIYTYIYDNESQRWYLNFFRNHPNSQHNLQLLLSYVLSNFVLANLVLIQQFCADVDRDYLSHFRFPLRSYVQIISCEISLFIQLIFSSYFCFLDLIVLTFILRLLLFTYYLLLAIVISLSLPFLLFIARVLVFLQLRNSLCRWILFFLFLIHVILLSHVKPCTS